MYEPYYGLNAKPFRLTPDPGFLFESASHKRALSYLRYGIYCAEGFVVIAGAPGTGKTTLIKKALSELPAHEVVVAKLVTTQLEADDFLRSLAASLGLEFERLTKAGLLNSIENFLKEQARSKRRVLVLVDEAHHLSGEALEELRMLTNFQEDERALMQCFLIGQEELKSMVDSPAMEQFRQRVIASCHLKSLTGSETVAYIEHRLQHAGWDGQPIFSFGAYELIYRQTKGVPRLVNNLCERLLLRGYLEDRQEIDENLALSVIEEVAGETGGGDALDELQEAKEAIREVRRALRVVDSRGTESTPESEGGPDVFHFQTIPEQALADADLPPSSALLSPPSALPVEPQGEGESSRRQSATKRPGTVSQAEATEMRPAVASYVETATAALMEREPPQDVLARPSKTEALPDPTPYFGTQKVRTAAPSADRSYRTAQQVAPRVRERAVSKKPSFMAKLRKQWPNIGIAVILLGVVVVIFLPAPEQPVEVDVLPTLKQEAPLNITSSGRGGVEEDKKRAQIDEVGGVNPSSQ